MANVSGCKCNEASHAKTETNKLVDYASLDDVEKIMWRRRRLVQLKMAYIKERGVSKFQRRASGGRDGCNLRADSERG